MTPYYVQRGHLKVWNRNKKSKEFSDFVDLDYMGSFEFENGAFARSLIGAYKNKQLYSFYKTDIVNKSGKNFYLYCPKEYYDDAIKFIKMATDGNRVGKLTKERTDLYDSFVETEYIKNNLYQCKSAQLCEYKSVFTNFWWDIQNNFGFILGDDEDLKHFKEAMIDIYNYYEKQNIEEDMSK